MAIPNSEIAFCGRGLHKYANICVHIAYRKNSFQKHTHKSPKLKLTFEHPNFKQQINGPYCVFEKSSSYISVPMY